MLGMAKTTAAAALLPTREALKGALKTIDDQLAAVRQRGVKAATEIERLREEIADADLLFDDGRIEELRRQAKTARAAMHQAGADLAELEAARHAARERLHDHHKANILVLDARAISATEEAARRQDASRSARGDAIADLGEHDANRSFGLMTFLGFLTSEIVGGWAKERRGGLAALESATLPPPPPKPRPRPPGGFPAEMPPGYKMLPDTPMRVTLFAPPVARQPEAAPAPAAAPNAPPGPTRAQKRAPIMAPPPRAGEIQVEIIRPGFSLPQEMIALHQLNDGMARMGDRINLLERQAEMVVMNGAAVFVRPSPPATGEGDK